MKSIWTSRTYRDELREPKQGTRWPFYGRENHTSEQMRSRKTWRTLDLSSGCPSESAIMQNRYDNYIAASLAPITLGQVLDLSFGWEAVAG